MPEPMPPMQQAGQAAFGQTASSNAAATQSLMARIDWRVALGTIITLVWMAMGVVYLFGKVGWVNFVNLPTADIGSFLEGAFAPLAFLWLVIGHFMQQKEITANTEAIRNQQEITARQELHAQRDSYFKLTTLVNEQLGSIAAFHYMSVVGPSGTAELSMEEFLRLRSEASADSGLFVRKMLELALRYRDEDDGVQTLFFGTDIRTRHSTNFVNIFEKILKLAHAVDHDELVSDALLQGSPAGMLYRVIRTVRGDDLMDPFTGDDAPK